MKKHQHEYQPAPEPAPEPAAAPSWESSGEKKLKLRAKEVLSVEGITHQPGDEFELPEGEALALVGAGAAEQLP